MTELEVERAQHAGERVKGYTTYLGIIWSLFSGASFLFPLSNLYLQALPVYGEASLHAASASICSIFFLYFIYTSRINIAYASPRSKRVISIIAFIGGFITLLDYRNLLFENPPMPDFGPRNRAFLEYCLIFGLWTGAFTLLAMSEYMRANPKYIFEYETQEAVIKGISEMTPNTKRDMAQKLLKIMKEELENIEE